MIFNTLAIDADNEWIMIDSTIIRAHQHSAGALKKYRNWYARTRTLADQRGALVVNYTPHATLLETP